MQLKRQCTFNENTQHSCSPTERFPDDLDLPSANPNKPSAIQTTAKRPRRQLVPIFSSQENTHAPGGEEPVDVGHRNPDSSGFASQVRVKHSIKLWLQAN
jgi:hypothetical protein